MKKLKFLIIGFLLLSTGSAYAYENGDFQFWNTDAEEFKINKDLKFVLEEEFRWGDDAREFFYNHYDAGLFYTLNDYLSVGAGYRQIYELKSRKFKPENEPYATVTLGVNKDGGSFESRNRFEYRHFDYQTDSWRYRNKFTVKFPWKFTAAEIQPYVSDEVLMTFASGALNQFNQNRLASGVGFKVTKNIKADLYYMLVDTKSSGEWTDANVLGTKLKIAF